MRPRYAGLAIALFLLRIPNTARAFVFSSTARSPAPPSKASTPSARRPWPGSGRPREACPGRGGSTRRSDPSSWSWAREVGATFYGFADGVDELFTLDPQKTDLVLVEVPILEYQPFRSYGARQSLGVRFQFGAGFDKPLHVRSLEPPGLPPPSLNTRYFGYVRLVFEGRRYL